MQRLLRNRYFQFFLCIYITSAGLLTVKFHQPLADAAVVLLSFGIAFPLLAWILTEKESSYRIEKAVLKNELLIILFVVLFILWYITFGTSQINQLIPEGVRSVGWKNSIAVLVKKILVFVFIPFSIYKLVGFSIKDFGFLPGTKALFSKQNILVFSILSLAVILFQYFLSEGARPVREGGFDPDQLVTGLSLLFFWLLIEVGLIEEFFFRAVLQSRIAILLRSPVAGILISGLVFGLAHAPGLYLRGDGTEGISEQLPFTFWAAYTITFMSVAGIFLGIVWHRTKNIWLVMSLHAMVDLLPNFPEFVHTWNF